MGAMCSRDFEDRACKPISFTVGKRTFVPGCTEEITRNLSEICPACAGDGYLERWKIQMIPCRCLGGAISQVEHMPNGRLNIQIIECHNCFDGLIDNKVLTKINCTYCK